MRRIVTIALAAACLAALVAGLAGASAIITSSDETSISVKFDGYTCGQTHTFTDDTGQSVTGATADCPPPPPESFNIGEESILSGADNGNGNLLVSQSAALSEQATVRSLSFYVVNAAGNLRLGIYDNAGNLKAQTASFAAVAGWNTQPVATPVSLAPGTYWLAYLPSSNSLSFRKTEDGSSSGRYRSRAYGPMPSAFGSYNTTPSHWSFYATFTPDAAPPPPPPPPSGSCFSSPGSCGYPDPAYGNVGVPAGTSLTPSGSVTVNNDGAVIDGLDVTGTIDVNATNVTIRNTRITVTGAGCGPTDTCGNAAIHVGCACVVTVSRVELTANAPTTVEHGLRNTYGGQINVDHVYQHGNIDALCNCGNADIADSYSIIHLAIANDHLENLYLDGNTLAARHNTLLNEEPQTANIFANTDNGFGGPCSNHLIVTNNLLAGGGFTIYPCGNATSAGSSSLDFEDNRIARCGWGAEVEGGGGTWLCPNGADSRGYFPRGGSFGHDADTYCGSSTWAGNVWDDDGTAIDC